ncbi:MAG: TonB-dependent receptor, partial [Caulobacterales bacterium]|nr:TonB-dependent receptor [Caulobacterales bacterium]
SQDDSDIWGVSLTAEYQGLGFAELKSITSYREIDSAFSDDNDALPQMTAQTEDEFTQSQFSQEIQLIGQTEKFDWITGLYYFHEEALDDNRVTVNPGSFEFLEALPGPIFFLGGPPGTGPGDCGVNPFVLCAGGAGNPLNIPLDAQLDTLTDITVDNVALYAHGTYDFTDRLAVTLGVRATYEEKEFFISQFRREVSRLLGTDVFAIAPQTETDNWTNVSPKAGFEFKPSDDSLIYGTYSRGFRSGTFNGRATAQEVVVSVEPETVDAFELGYKGSFAGDSVRLTGAIFYNDYEDLQVQAVLADPVNLFRIELINAGAAEVYGAELELAARPTERIDLTAAFGYANSEIVEIDQEIADATGIVEGNALQRTPEWTAAVSGQYTHPANWGEAFARFDYSWQDDIFHTADNLGLEEAYGLLDLRAGVNLSNGLEVALYGVNVTDEVYYNSIFINGSGAGVGYPARPAEYGASLRKRF